MAAAETLLLSIDERLATIVAMLNKVLPASGSRPEPMARHQASEDVSQQSPEPLAQRLVKHEPSQEEPSLPQRSKRRLGLLPEKKSAHQNGRNYSDDGR